MRAWWWRRAGWWLVTTWVVLDIAAGLTADDVIENQVATRTSGTRAGQLIRLHDGKSCHWRSFTTKSHVTTTLGVPRLRTALDDVTRGCHDVIVGRRSLAQAVVRNAGAATSSVTEAGGAAGPVVTVEYTAPTRWATSATFDNRKYVIVGPSTSGDRWRHDATFDHRKYVVVGASTSGNRWRHDATFDHRKYVIVGASTCGDRRRHGKEDKQNQRYVDDGDEFSESLSVHVGCVAIDNHISNQLLTLAITNTCIFNPLKSNSSNYYILPYRYNLPFLISDIRALWRSAVSARVPECRKLKMVG